VANTGKKGEVRMLDLLGLFSSGNHRKGNYGLLAFDGTTIIFSYSATNEPPKVFASTLSGSTGSNVSEIKFSSPELIAESKVDEDLANALQSVTFKTIKLEENGSEGYILSLSG
jgi:dipeptidyl aminopeptidase/acylaminoacyl peptidase